MFFFHQWCYSSKVKAFAQLCELLLVDFKNSLPGKIVLHLNEQKITTFVEVAVCADEFILMHKSTFVSTA